ncbi:MAG: hypothetical protein AB7D51_05105 [Desulfovibrionaceae bacterium]
MTTLPTLNKDNHSMVPNPIFSRHPDQSQRPGMAAALLAGIGLCITVLVQEGVSVQIWNMYGFQRVIKLTHWLPQYDLDVLLPTIRQSTFPLLATWHSLTHVIYSTPALFIACSALTFVLIFLALERIGSVCLSGGSSALLYAGIAVLSHSALLATSASTGMTNGLYFTDCSTATALILPALYLLLRDRPLAASVLFCVALQVHVFHAFVSYILISLPYTAMKLHERNFRHAMCIHLLPALAVFYTIHVSGAVHLEGTSGLTLQEWLHFSYYRDPDDMTMTFPFLKAAVPLAAFTSAHFALRDDTKLTYIDFFVVCCNLICIGCVLIEALHAHGVVFGKLSEMFTVLGFRRGLWILHILVVLGCLSSSCGQQRQRLRKADLPVLLLLACCLVGGQLFLPLALLAVSVLKISIARGKSTGLLMATYVAIVIGTLPLLALLEPTTWYARFLGNTSAFFEPRYVAFAIGVAVTSLAVRWLPAIPSQQTALRGVFIFVLCTTTLTMPAGAGRRIAEAATLATRSHISYEEILSLLSGEHGLDESLYVEAQQAAREFGKDGRVLLPPIYTITDPHLTAGLPTYLFERYDRSFALHSLEVARDYDHRLREVLREGIMNLYKGEDFWANMIQAWNRLTPADLASIMQKNNISAVITLHEIPEAKSLFHNELYSVYSAESIYESEKLHKQTIQE